MRIFSVVLATCFLLGGILLLLGVGVDKTSLFEPYRVATVAFFWLCTLLLGIAPFTRMWVR